MKGFRFFSVAVAVIVVLFVSVWAGSVTYGFTTLNGFATGETSLKCYTLTGPGTSYLTNVRVTGKLSSTCIPATGQIRLYQLNGAQRILIGSTTVPLSPTTSFSDFVMSFPPNTYPANGTYCFSGYVRYNNSDTLSTSCEISLTISNVTWEWFP
jgi:hypothetical protein